MTVQTWLAQLQENGYRLTSARRAVVATIAASPRALTPVEVYDAARAEDPALGLVTVYRTLEKLEELGLIQRVHQPRGCQAFITAGTGHQHLLLCKKCGRTTLVEGDDLEQFTRAVALKTGYEINEHWLQFFGLCEKCK